MTFAKLALYFEELEATPSRLKLIDILCDLFRTAKADEVSEVAYLLQGRVAPFYEATEIGMAEKSVASSIARVYEVGRSGVLKKYSKLGDLGKVAEKLAKGKRGINNKLSVKQVFKTFQEIAQTHGEGTVEKKISALSFLLKSVDATSAKHLVRIPLGNSRLGIGDPTILDAWAKLKLGDRNKRAQLEAAYNRVSDLGLIGETLFKKGLSGVDSLGVTVGKPLRSELCERITDPKAILEKYGGETHVQQKWDGFRVQLHLDRSRPKNHQVKLFSRNLEETTRMFPELVEGVLKQVKAKSAILDAEALAFNPTSEEFLPFQQTAQRRRKYDIEEMAKKLPLKAFVFDIMYLNGKSLVNKRLKERVGFLPKVIKGDEILIAQPGEFVKTAKKLDELFAEALSKGLEGVITKRPQSYYEAGARNFNWIKLKRHSSGELKDTIDCVILGYIFGRGKRAEFGAGALLVGVYDKKKDGFVTVSRIGTGLSDQEWRQIHKRADKIRVDKKPARVNSLIVPSVWIRPEIVIEVLADEITRSPLHTAGKSGGEPGYALRFPRLVSFRTADKKAEDATSVDELVKMYRSQYKK